MVVVVVVGEIRGVWGRRNHQRRGDSDTCCGGGWLRGGNCRFHGGVCRRGGSPSLRGGGGARRKMSKVC